jgi:hypothetical protein
VIRQHDSELSAKRNQRKFCPDLGNQRKLCPDLGNQRKLRPDLGVVFNIQALRPTCECTGESLLEGHVCQYAAPSHRFDQFLGHGIINGPPSLLVGYEYLVQHVSSPAFPASVKVDPLRGTNNQPFMRLIRRGHLKCVNIGEGSISLLRQAVRLLSLLKTNKD